MEIILGVSNKHIHLTEEDYKLLFNEERQPFHRPAQLCNNGIQG